MIKKILSVSNQKSNVVLTVEKLSGFGVLCNKSAVHLSRVSPKKVDCIFVAENKSIANIKNLTI